MLFGEKQRSRIPVPAVIGSEDAASDLREAQRNWNAGYRAFKIKVGPGSPETDAARARAICLALKRESEPSVGPSAGPDAGPCVEPCLVSADTNRR
jgi:L-alanine-DL-glutamate epimerase-like enolase superfamily enzyme